MGTGVVLAELLRSTGSIEREIGTPSLKRSAKTFAPMLVFFWDSREAMRKKQTKRSASNP